MSAIMRRTVPLALVLLAACRTAPSDGDDTSVAHAAGPKSSQMATMLQDKNYTPNVSNPADNQAPRTQATTSADAVPGVAAPVAVDANQRREYEDVYVDMKDPNGQKGLVYYLMKPDVWHIDKVVQMTPTTKHWRFWRVARTDGKAMPEVDPLRPRRP
jgi:hypothetical protein